MMVLASLLFATMGVCVKLASPLYSAGELVFYRSLVGVLVLPVLIRSRGISLRTPVAGLHIGRSASGVAALCLWFYAIGQLPLATAMTLNYMSSVWMALFLVGGAVLVGSGRVDGMLVAAVLVGFAGVALVLQPSTQGGATWHGLAGLLSGVLAALAYLQVASLTQAGEPEERVVFYFSVGGALAGGVLTLVQGLHGHTFKGAALLLATGVLALAAQMLLTRAYAVGKPLANAALHYLGLVFAYGYGVLLFDDQLTTGALAGMGLIVLAGLATTLVRSRQAQAPAGEPPES